MQLKYKYKVGDLVKITNICNFNKEFVKVGDIAKVISLDTTRGARLYHTYYSLKSKNWKYSQCSQGFDIELYEPKKNKKATNNEIKQLKARIKQLEENLKEQTPKIIKRITLKQFFESKDKLAIHCSTEEQARSLLDAFNRMHKTWNNGDSYDKDATSWIFGKENMCYLNNGTWGIISEVLKGNVYNFEEVDLTIPLEYLCSKEEKTILKNLDKEYQFIYKDKQGNTVIQKDYDFEFLNMFTGLFKSLEPGKKYKIWDLIKE